MLEQETAWDRGDIPGFMNGYADSVCFITLGSRMCGKAEVTTRYLARYPDKDAMGDLTFTIDEVLLAGADHAWLTGTWSVARAADTLGGGFSLLWKMYGEDWLIVRDHTY